MKKLFQDPDDPRRTSRAKVTALATTLVSALYLLARFLGLELEVPQDLALPGAVALLSLAQYFLRDRRTPEQER